MNPRLLLLMACGLSGLGFSGSAQTYSKAYLEANNIRSSVNTYGNMWYDPTSSNPECEYPKGSGKHMGYASAFWITGKVPGDTAVATATIYYGGGKRDVYSGPLDANGNSNAATTSLWERIWSIRRTTIDSFRILAARYSTDPVGLDNALSNARYKDLKEWPAKGNVYATGTNNQLITYLSTATRNYAPFVDVDGDGRYNYLKGDYPKIKGEQMLWAIYNDMAGIKTQSMSRGLGMEIHLSAYAYVRGTIADNIQFYEYKIFNRGTTTIDSARVSIWSDLDLGYSADDYTGFDSAHRMGYVYNGTAVDGNGAVNHYGANPPISGIVLLQTVGDVNGSRIPAGAFTPFTQGSGTPACMQDPSTAKDFYYLSAGFDKCGQPFTNPVTGRPSKTVYPDAPGTAGGWSECARANPVGDRRAVLASPQFQMAAGSNYTVAFALVVSPNAGGCPTVDLTGIKATADTALKIYNQTPTAVTTISAFNGVTLYPNPAHSTLTLSGMASNNATVRVLDVTGKAILVPQQPSGGSLILNTEALSSGIYLLQITDATATEVRRFVKE